MQDIKIVIGGNFGDEGKGLMTDYFAAEAVNAGRKTLVVLSNGGAQRGHTVTTPTGIRLVFHHFGSGTLAGADTWLPRFFIVNPMIFIKEYEELITKKVQFARMQNNGSTTESKEISGINKDALKNEIRIFMDPECPVTTPFDMITNQILEESRGANRHGSCGVGIWETLLRDGLLLGEMAALTNKGIYDYLDKECRAQMERRLLEFGIEEIPEKWKDITDSEDLLFNYIQDFREMCRRSRMRSVDIMGEYDRVIFEAGQGLLLDRGRKEFGCHTTPSNTGLRNPAELIREYNVYKKITEERTGNPAEKPGIQENNEKTQEINGKKKNINGMINFQKYEAEVCYVTRTYLTRHGAGPFKEECRKEEINPYMKDLTNVPNPHQGTLRYGKLDVGEFLRRIREDYDSEKFPKECNVRMTWAVTHVNEYMPKNMSEVKAVYYSDGETNSSVRKTLCRDGEAKTNKRPA